MILKCDPARLACGLLVGLLALAPCSEAGDAPATTPLVRLKSTAPFDPLQPIPDVSRNVPKAQSLQKSAPVPAFVVQFSGPMTATRQSAVAALGFKVLDYVPDNALVVRAEAKNALERLGGLDDVRAVFELTPGFKLSSELTGLPEPSAPPEKTYTIGVSMFTGSQPEAFVRSVLAAFPGVSLVWRKQSDPPAARFVVPAKSLGSVVGALAIHGDVEFVDLVHEPQQENDNSVWIHQSYGSNGPAEASAADPKPYATTATIWQKGLLGQGQIVGDTDRPFDITMQQFDDPNYPNVTVQTVVASDTAHAIQPNPNHRKIWAINAPGGVYPVPLPPLTGCVRHGTHTSGSIAGDCRTNLPSLVATSSCPNPPCYGHDTGDGMAPLAKLLLELGAPGEGGAVSDSISQQWVAGARLTSFSWAMSGEDIDYGVWRHPDFAVFVASGNSAGVGTLWSDQKNAIVVGNSHNYGSGLDPENMDYRSSQGPTSDGRIKPDIVAVGSPVRSSHYPILTITDPAQCDPNSPNYCKPRDSGVGCFVWDTATPCGTWFESGTSMSTPTAAGLGALTRQYFTDGFYPSGAAVGGNSVVPSAALLKAVLINGARNMIGVSSSPQSTPLDDAPSFHQGWGRLELDDALYFSGDARKLWLKDVTNGGGLQTFDRTLYNLQVTGASTAPLKITLAWTDAPNATLTTSSLVDDLDITVTGPDGTIYRGNQWDDTSAHGDKRSHPYAARTACADPNNPSALCRDGVNNVEGILIPAPTSGLYRVRLDGRNVPGYVPDGVTKQGYALVVTGAATSIAGDVCTPGPAPQGLAGSVANWNDVVLSWQAVPGAVSYQIRRSTTSCSEPNFVQDVTTNGPIHIQTAANTHYYFTVRADVAGSGCQTASSNCVEVTTPAAPAVAGSTPAFIPNTDQALVTITGSNLVSALIYLGTTAQPQKYELTLMSVSPTQIVAKLPGNEQSAAYNLRVVFPSTFPDIWTLNNAVTITAPLQVSTIFTANTGLGPLNQHGSLSAINLSTMALMETRDLGTITNPVDLTIRKQRDLGLLAFYYGNTIRAFVPETRTILRTLSTVPDTPSKVAFDPSGNTAYVLSAGYPLTLRKLDMNTFTFTGPRLDLGSWGSGTMELSPDGSSIYVSNYSDPGSVFVVRASDLSLVATIPVGVYPVGMALSADGTRLYVANMGSASVSVINFAGLNTPVSTFDVSDGVSVSCFPYALALSGGNALLHVAYTNGGSGPGRANFDPATGNRLSLVSGDPQWFGLEYWPSTSKLYAISIIPPALMRWNKDTLATEASVTVGEGPRGISIAEIVPLTITSVSPDRSCHYGGTAVTIRGSGFQGEVRDDNNNIIQNRTRVFFGGTESTSVTLVDSTTITAITPPHAAAAAAVPVLVSNPNGSGATLSGVFRYQKCLVPIGGGTEE